MRTNVRSGVLVLGMLTGLGVLSGCPKDPPIAGGAIADGGSANAAGQNGNAGASSNGQSTVGNGGSDGAGLAGAGGTTRHDAGAADASDAAIVTRDGGAADGGVVECTQPCEAYQHCELVQVQCIRAPCPPLPQCVDNATCGGFAGIACPGKASCEDDPRDSCDPSQGGADCGGLCVCAAQAKCADGWTWDEASCACIAQDTGADASVGVPCGKNVCAVGEVCCNESCGICTSPKGACIQLFCS